MGPEAYFGHLDMDIWILTLYTQTHLLVPPLPSLKLFNTKVVLLYRSVHYVQTLLIPRAMRLTEGHIIQKCVSNQCPNVQIFYFYCTSITFTYFP